MERRGIEKCEEPPVFPRNLNEWTKLWTKFHWTTARIHPSVWGHDHNTKQTRQEKGLSQNIVGFDRRWTIETLGRSLANIQRAETEGYQIHRRDGR